MAVSIGALCASLWTGPAFAEKRVALIVGNSAYQNAPTLPNPARDARAIAAMFKKSGYDVVSTAYDLGNLDFKRTMRQFEDAAADADIAVVYYAGHGIEIHGTNYVVPVDARLASDRDADDEAIPLDRLVDATEGAKRLRVIILDACRDNPFSRNMKLQRTAMRGVTAGLADIQPSTINTLIAYAAKSGSQAEDGSGDHSPFATALMNDLFVPGLDIRLAFGRVRDDVMKATGNHQEPFVYGSLGGGTIAIVAAPDKPQAVSASDAVGERKDYELVAQIGTKGAFQVYLAQHPTGFYSELARQNIAKMDAAEGVDGTAPKPTLVAMSGANAPVNAPAPAPAQTPPNTVVAALEPPKPPTPPGPTSEELRAWDKIKDSSSAVDYRDFIKKYPKSPLADSAQMHLDTLDRAAKEQAAKAQAAKEEADRAAAEAKRQAELAEAKRQADDAARKKAEQAAQLAATQKAAQAAERARLDAEREAALKREEEAHQAALAALKAAEAKQQADAADASRKQAEQAAQLAAAQQAAQAAEKARLDAERTAQAQKEATCKNEQDRLTVLQGQGAKARDDLKQLQQSLICDRLRPMVTAALDKANALPDMNTPTQIRSAQQELSRVGCYTGTVDGSLTPTTTVAVQHYQAARGKAPGAVDITDAFIADIKKQPARICPLVCPTGKVAQGETCVATAEPTAPAATEKPAESEQKPVAKQSEPKKPAPKKTAAKPAPAPHHEEARTEEPRPAPHATEQASSYSSGGGGGGGGGGGHSSMIGVGF